MLSERRGGDRRGAIADGDRVREGAVPADSLVLEGREDAFRFHLWMIEHVLDGTGGGAGDALAEERLPFDGGASGEGGTDLRHDLVRMRGALLHGVEARIGSQLGEPDELAQGLPEMRGIGGDVEAAALRRMQAGDPARAQVTGDVAALALRPDETCGLHGERAPEQ